MLLAEYNGRLMAELEERKEVAQMLAAFMKQQLDKVAEAEKRLEVVILGSVGSTCAIKSGLKR